ncbi:MAG: N-acetyltransferase [Elusimicrobia bacterium]|nr:N-acetyltransferase [Elusimicrobiota bacterium]
MPIELRELSESGTPAFVGFPYELFKGHPYWVGELKSEARRLLSLAHPFWRHGERKLFMAFKDGKPAGRLAAVLNHKHNAFHDEKCGFFGFFDCIDDREVSSAMFESTLKWLKSSGMDKVRGPVNPSTNETCGLLIEGFDSPPMVMTPYNPAYYAALIEAAGFAKAKDLYAFQAFTKSGFPERMEKIVARMTRAGKVSLELVDIRRIKEALADLKEIYNSAWERNWGFVPMSDEEIDELARALKPLLKPEYLYFARVDGRAAGFVLLLPDFNIALKGVSGSLNPLNILPFLYRLAVPMRRGRLLALGVKKEFRGRGVELLLIKQAFASAASMKWEYGDLSWTLEDNDRMNNVIAAAGGKVYKKFRIYEKTI